MMPLAYPQEKGDPVEILGRDYYFERVDPDHAVTYRAPYGASYPDFMAHMKELGADIRET